MGRILRGMAYVANHRAISLAGASLLITFLAVFCYVQQPLFLKQMDYKVYDLMLRSRPPATASPEIVIIDIDEASLAEFGQWPWPRYLLAQLIDKLMNCGVASIGVDILLIEPDRSSPGRIREDLKKYLNVDVLFEGLPPILYSNDNLLAEVLKNSRAVLGMYGQFDKAPDPDLNFPNSVSYIMQSSADARPLEELILRAHGATLPLPEFMDAAPMGMLNISPDEDGIVRRVPLVALMGEEVYPSLAVRTLMAATNKKNLVLRSDIDGLRSLKIGPYEIPVSPEGFLLVPFKGASRHYTYIPAVQVLKGEVGREQLEGRIAFLGTSATGLLDIRATPFDNIYPGVEVHATVLDSIMSGRFIENPPWAPGMQVLAMLICGAAAGFAFAFARPRLYAPVGAGLLLAVIYLSFHLFGKGFYFSPLYCTLTLAGQGSLLLMLRFWHEERQKIVLRTAFSRYVAPEVVSRITKMEGDIFAGEEKDLTIMFTDIRGFTSISEKLQPQQVVKMLNRYFTPMTALVRENKGTLDKFIGDALMAFWNAPLPVPGHERLAVATAVAMQDKLVELNHELEAEFGCSLRMGVGLHSGKAYVGNMGSEDLLNYTLIGDNVNLTSRLEGLCPKYGTGIVTSSDTMQACTPACEGGEFAFQQLDKLRVKGKQLPVECFTVIKAEEAAFRQAELDQYHKALALYFEGDFIAAKPLFSNLQENFPNVQLYQIYSERVGQLLASPPEHWDGVWILDSK